MHKILKIIVIALVVLVLAAAGGLGFLTFREYRPDSIEEIVPASGTETLHPGDRLTLLTYNTGYAALSRDEDFFMDGGSRVAPQSQDLVEENLAGIAETLIGQDTDICFLQEVDIDSDRSFHINEMEYYEDKLGLSGMFACNFDSVFVPYPIPPIGRVNSGLMTTSIYQVSEASRFSLPVSFKWPVRIANLKRCLLIARIPVDGTDKELVLINFHLEAYDNGEGKIAQSRMLADILQREYEKGNYCIAGGDFNQTFDGIDAWPIHDTSGWVPGKLYAEDLPEHYSFAVADNAPTCRLLNGPYSGNYEDSQVYVIDGFVISDNLKLEKVENIDLDFRYADHQPVRLEVILPE